MALQRAATLADLDVTETGRLLEECPDAVDLLLLNETDIDHVTQTRFNRQRLTTIKNYVLCGNALDDTTTLSSLLNQHLVEANSGAAQNRDAAIGWVWREGHPFCETSGSSWTFQMRSVLRTKSGVTSQIISSTGMTTTKTRGGKHPLFLCLGGAGTGKSRLLDELPRIAQNVALAEAHVS